MKPKKLRRFIKETVRQVPQNRGISYRELLGAVWTKDMNTPIKRIDRAIQKMMRWGKLRLEPPTKDREAHFFMPR